MEPIGTHPQGPSTASSRHCSRNELGQGPPGRCPHQGRAESVLVGPAAAAPFSLGSTARHCCPGRSRVRPVATTGAAGGHRCESWHTQWLPGSWHTTCFVIMTYMCEWTIMQQHRPRATVAGRREVDSLRQQELIIPHELPLLVQRNLHPGYLAIGETVILLTLSLHRY